MAKKLGEKEKNKYFRKIEFYFDFSYRNDFCETN